MTEFIKKKDKKKNKKTAWIVKKPKKESTLTGSDTTHGGGPDAGNIGHNKDFIYKTGKMRQNLKAFSSGGSVNKKKKVGIQIK